MFSLDRILYCSPGFQTGLEVTSYSVDWPQTISHSSTGASRVLERQAQPLCLASVSCFHFHFLTETLLLQEWKRSRQDTSEERMMFLFSLSQASLEPVRKNLTNSKRKWTAECVVGLVKSAHLLGKYSTACP